jgi:predicted alpha-1,2-mannosidase
MLKTSLYFNCAALLLLVPAGLLAQNARHVDPFLGTDGGGNTFPGAVLPFGMVKAGPDTGDNTANAGWTPDKPINGFSQTHVSGTGGGAKYGNILIQPTTGEFLPQDHSSDRASEHASAGSYGVTLTRFHVTVDIAAARRAALYQFTYPASDQANILIDAGHLLSSYANQKEDQRLVASSVKVVSPTEITGSTTVTGGWNYQTTNYTIFFYAVSDTPATKSGTWRSEETTSSTATGDPVKPVRNVAYLSFKTHDAQAVHVKLGISLISVAQAKRNALTELPSFNFAQAKAAAEHTWDRALAPLTVEGASDDELKQLYTGIYHAMLMPTDRTGENPLWTSAEPSYDDFYAIWDTFRSSSPLLTLIAPNRETAIVRSLIDIYRHDGWVPDARSGNASGRIQGGTDGDMTIADGYLKHLPGVNWAEAYKAVVHDAEGKSPNPIDVGRGDLDEWRDKGYLTIEGTDRPASKHMEYAANDYAIALMAKGMGKQDDYAKYSKRAANWKNLWDTDATDHGFSGFVWPRHRDGSYKANFDPLLTGTWGGDNFYEGNSWTYSTFVPQDVAGLIAASGGKEKFVERMDAFFSLKDRYDVGNEPGFLAPYLYIWAGRPDRTQTQIRAIIAKNYNSSRSGIPGNDDSGAMGSWFAFGKIGFYPNAAQDVYLIGSPAYGKVTFHLANGRSFIVEAEGNAADKPYIASATWDGKPYTRAWFTHEQLMRGGTLHLVMSATPTQWGASDPPPSMSDAPRTAAH